MMSKEGNEYFVCNLDGTLAPEYLNSVSDELIGLVKKANAVEEFTTNSQVQPSEETQFSSTLDHRPSTKDDESQEHLLQWPDGKRTCTHESDITDADILTLYTDSVPDASEGNRGRRSQ
ncbi:hypothetical protein SARC_02554 [Sphaeroforma arctica JP610]|uniref:Uncharacterized protein n=1 Tax=Sphaeroforma arctica JP610 TaxID=667725 RepID=A0A0L0GAI2_9EUKA|nr:hypothetical protein SARC_02554 [Sphaeroforma arctica JP610]KNC85258.1 hypothetical protein SARC_02554 [Sphaeroforma arctica JP610]|eukprot:XP_014159160.1 hypothetical protein SARC_02554 [Sphaeroforma arctica JP610]